MNDEWDRHDQDLPAVSPRSRGVALALCMTIGVFGGHRYYVGKIGTGLLMLCTMGGLGMWWLYDVITLAAGSFRDAEGRRVVRWAEADMLDSLGGRLRGRDQELILGELDHMRGDVSELQERVDFLERMLARARERGAMGPGER